MDSPSPGVPSPPAFVVKKGLKILAWISGECPSIVADAGLDPASAEVSCHRLQLRFKSSIAGQPRALGCGVKPFEIRFKSTPRDILRIYVGNPDRRIEISL